MDGEPRLAPLREDEWDDQQRAVLEILLRSPTQNIYKTVVRAPELADKTFALGRSLRGEGLPDRHRETLILRTGWNCGCNYEFAQHRRAAGRAGMDDADIERIEDGPGADGWDEVERLLCVLADELHATNRITDETWSKLAAHYDERQLIQAILLVGYYHLVSYVLNGLRVPLEEGVRGFDRPPPAVSEDAAG